MDTHSVLRGGTNLGDALRHAVDSFTDDGRDHKAIILFSDGGETEESYPLEAAQHAFSKKGIRVFTLGVGDPIQGARIPITRNGQRTYVKHGEEELWTKLDPTPLKSMAAAADGVYFSSVGEHVIYDRVCARVAPGEAKSIRRRLRHARFHWFACLALVLLTAETLMTDRKVIVV